MVYKLFNVPFFILTISVTIGILLGYYIPLDLNLILSIVCILIICLYVSWWYAKRMFNKSYSFSILTILVFIHLGIGLVTIYNPKNDLGHYSQLIPTKESLREPLGIQFYIKERLKPTSYYHKYIISVQILKNKIASGDILLRIPRDSSNTKNLSIGDSYLTYAVLKPIAKPLNPHQFDYAKYLSKQYIYHQLTLSKNQLTHLNTIKWSLYRVADNIRTAIHDQLTTHGFTQKQLSIINALVLGQRQDIDKDIMTAYRNAGAAHMLAVSGLHVGILLGILNFILAPLNRFRKKGIIIKTVIIISLLWSFAIIAGLSPSVLRAVTMFSFIAIGQQLRTKTSIYNALFISFFILICCNPLLLFSIGFQLSYVAVFSIIWIQPFITKFYNPRFYIDRKLWETFTTTMAAQLGILPLTLFYFHQFPLLFFIANLLIVPLLGIILGAGIFCIILAKLNLLFNSIVTAYGKCIDTMNSIVQWVSHQEAFLITKISFSREILIISYILLICIVLLCKKYAIKKLILVGVSTIVLLLIMNFEKYYHIKNEEFVVFHSHRNTIIGILQQRSFKTYSSSNFSEMNKNYILQNYITNKNSNIISSQKLKNVYTYKKKVILIIDSTGIYNIERLQPDIIILSNSPKVHLERIIKKLKPTKVIADASNYTSYLDQWEISCQKLEIPFHRTDKKGAFILKN